MAAHPYLMPWSACFSTDPRMQRAEALAEEIVELSAHLAAAEARFIELIARFDEEELWACQGARSCAHWLNWQCGISLHAARERVRVARALAGLPLIREAFERGAVSYSKVRAMTRVAVPESQEMLLSIARYGTAAHMDRLVRQYHRVERIEAAAEASARYRNRSVQYRYGEDGMMVISARLPPEIGEVVRRAIDSAVELLYRDGRRKELSEEPDYDGDDHRNATAAGSVVAILDDAAEVTATFETEPRVPVGTSGAASGSNVPAGTSGPADEDATPPYPRAHRRPDGRAVVEEFEGQESAQCWGARRADALRLLAESYLAGGWRQLSRGTAINTSADRYQVVVHIDQALLAEASPPRPHRCAIENGPALALDTVRRLACESALVGMVDGTEGEPLSVGRKTRAIPPAIERALRARDGGCRFPCCDRTLFLQAHHIVHWANGGETKLENLISLCTFHHALLHEGGFNVKKASDGAFVFYDPTGRPLPATGRVPRHTMDALARAAADQRVAIADVHRTLGQRISAETAACGWAGERMDYHMAVGGLVYYRDRARRRAATAVTPIG